MTYLRYTILPVGQGTGALLQVMETDDICRSAILMDLGSRLWRTDKTGHVSAGIVVEQLKKVKVKVNGTEQVAPRFDAVFLSHGDVDHINLVQSVLKEFKKPSEGQPRAQTLVVENIVYGGAKSQYAKSKQPNVIDSLNAYRPGANSVVRELKAPIGDLKAPLYRDLDNRLVIYVMSGNTVPAETSVGEAEEEKQLNKGSAGYKNNTVSLVLVVQYGTDVLTRFIVMGDATGMSIVHAHDTLKSVGGGLGNIVSVTLPHHGSAVTTYDLLGAEGDYEDPDEFAEYNITSFVEAIRPPTVTVSSGEVGVYKLPSARVIADFAVFAMDSPYVDDALKAEREHFYTSYLRLKELKVLTEAMELDDKEPAKWPSAPGFYTLRTDKAVYTIDYFNPVTPKAVPAAFPYWVDLPASDAADYDPAPPWGAGWSFTVSADGRNVNIHRVLDLRGATTATREHLTRRLGELSEDRFVFLPSAEPAPPSDDPPPPRPAVVAAVPRPHARPAPPEGLRRVRHLP